MKSLRRPLSLLLTLAMVLSLFCGAVPVAAAGESEGTPAPSAIQSNLYCRIYEPQLLKLLYVTGQISGADGVAITGVTMQFDRKVDGQDSRELKLTGSPAYYCPMGPFGLLEQKLNTSPDNIKQLHVTYTAGGEKRMADLAASQLGYVKTAEDTCEIRVAGDSVYTVAFYDTQGPSLRLHSVRFVESGKKLGAGNLPANPDSERGHIFVNWDQNRDGGAPFDPNQPIKGDMVLYARQLTSAASGTEFHVINRDGRLLARTAEQYNAGLAENNPPITAEQIDPQSVNVVVMGEGRRTDPGKTLYGWMKNMEYFLVSNTALGDTHVSPAKVEKLEVSFRLKGSQEIKTVSFDRGYAADEFQVTVLSSNYIAEILFNAPPAPLTGEETAAVLPAGAVKVSCATPGSGHGSERYDLLKDSISRISEVRYTARGYECQIVLSSKPYTVKFGQSHGAHDSGEPAERTITMRYTENREWTAVDALPVEFQVKCAPAVPGHTLTYDANGGHWEGGEMVRTETNLPAGWHELSYTEGASAPVHEPVKRDGAEIKVLFAGWSLDHMMKNVILDKNGAPSGMIAANGLHMGQDFTAYAVWAEDRNGNGMPDYQEKDITVRFDAAPGTSGEPKEFTLVPFPEKTKVFFAPEAVPPKDQNFVKWALQGNGAGTLSSRAGFTYDSIFKMTGGKMSEVTFRAVYQSANMITIRPADVTIYMGGSGYRSVVKDHDSGETASGVSNGFPEPAFRITLPKSLQERNVPVTQLVLKYQNGSSMLTWRLEKYGAGQHDLYRLVPGEGTDRRPVRMEFKKDGRIITEDQFDVARNLNQTLEMMVYGEGIRMDQVFFTLGSEQYPVSAENASLTVRGTTGGVRYSTVNGEKHPEARMPEAAAAAGTTYAINGSPVQLADASGVSLLFDNVIETNRVASATNSELLAARADQFLGGADSGRRYEFKYLDLVDRNNGNVWVTPSQNITVYWPLPSGTGRDTQFQLLRFPGLQRSTGAEAIADAIRSSQVSRGRIVGVTDTHVVIEVGGRDFAPFALVWQDKTEDQVTITYTPNGGQGQDRIAAYSKGSAVQVAGRLFDRPGYTFTGWNTAANGKGTAYSVGQKLTLTGSLKLYAQWHEDGSVSWWHRYALYYETNGGKKLETERGKAPWVKEYKKLPVPVREGYTFEGWYRNKVLTQAVTGDVAVGVSGVTLYAKWRQNGTDPKADKYMLSYETNGGKKLEAESAGKPWVKEYKKLPVPVREGYTFEGWYRDKGLMLAVTGNLSVDGGVTLYAKWREDQTADHTGVSKWLNTKDHSAYLKGLPNNRFGPGQNITRAEVAQMFYNLLLNRNVPITVAFTDVPADAWYADAVKTLASMGVIKGVGGTRFAPSRNITRAEFTAIAMRFGSLEGSDANGFSDVKASDWFCREVSGAVRYGWIKGFTDGTFRPYLPITRAEVTVITNRMLERSADRSYVDRNAGKLRQFTDVKAGDWAYYDILEAANGHSYSKSGGVENWNQ